MSADPSGMLVAGRFRIPADHPALAGHFPGRPVVPGVVVLDHLLSLVGRCMAGHAVGGLRQVKFLRPVLPGEEIEARYAPGADGMTAFACLRAGQPVTTGVVALRDRAA